MPGRPACNSRNFWIGDGLAGMPGTGHLSHSETRNWTDELNEPEIILKLWYIGDEMGMIYSLRARAYVGTGSDGEKLAFLCSRAALDYLVAQPFPIPDRFHITLVDGWKEEGRRGLRLVVELGRRSFCTF